MGEQGIPIIGPILNRIIGTRNERFVKKYTQRVQAINAMESKIRALTDAQIRAKTAEFRERIDKGEKPDDMMIEVFAVAREAMDRAVGIRNIFNPKANFDPAAFSPEIRDLYVKLKAQMDALEPAPPTGAWRGNDAPIPGWRQLDIPNEIYDAVRTLFPESRPPFRARPFDVQLIGGMVLTQGKIAEMKTGEGKTIVGPLATYLACLERLKVHVVTVNDYLVQRDRDWTAPFFRALDLTVGAIHPMHMQDEEQKRVMYSCDVVYGTTAEFGFDYLRDNMKRSADQQVQRRRDFAIVDEVDSILIDEARTPLIISGQAHEDNPRYDLADRLARHLVDKQRPWNQANEKVERCKLRMKGLEGEIRQTRDQARIPALKSELTQAKTELVKLESERDQFTQYYEVKMERKQAYLTHEGVSEAQRVAGIGSFYVDQNIDLPHQLEQALRAHVVYELDRDYVIMNVPDPVTQKVGPTIVIVDVNTGRPMIGRQWSDGLHQAVECKERVPIKEQTQTVAKITIQNFFKMYKRLAGMTGTADTEAQEFHDIYKLDVVAIPTNRQVIRRDFDDMIFLSAKDKWSHIVDEIKRFHDVGRPILVGTTSVEKSETLAKMLASRYGVQHEVLNAKQHEREAHIIENAGQLGAVMIATNMAGRGTDIKLGPISRETLLDHWLRRGIAPRTLTVQATDEELREQIFRKVASTELDIAKKEAQELPFAELELRLLRHWAAQGTWLSPKQIENAKVDELREALDENGRFILHRIRWFSSIEDMGGLHVIGTERHEARRIDNQLRGRAGRQGDKGSSRFFVSLDDELMKLFAGETAMRFLSRMGMKEGDAIEHPMLSKSVERAQRKVEERNFQIRKHILEYDEVMEYQRQTFYGMRQRVLEGRDLKGMILDFMTSTVDDSVKTYLDPDYRFQCAAEYARSVLDASIAFERLRNKELAEMDTIVRADARDDMRQNIEITLGEYMPMEGSEVSVDFDSAGLLAWARSRFGVELDAAELREGGIEERRRVKQMLIEAAERAIDSADLSGLATYTAPDYGARELASWCKEKLNIEVDPDALMKASRSQAGDGVTPVSLIMDKAKAMYAKREAEYPVDYALQVTQMIMRQAPAEAAQHMLAWCNSRFAMGWTPEIFRTSTPQKVREALVAAARKQIEEGYLEKQIAAAQACATDEDLEKHFLERYQRPLPENMRRLKGPERADAIAARVEGLLRAELVQFERTIMLDVFDSTWKDHLYAMDQLQDTINYRVFSQLDPRIQFKREGSTMFNGMLGTMRERVSEYVFKASLTPQFPGMPGAPTGRSPMGGAPRPAMPRSAPPGAGTGIVGPGIPNPSMPSPSSQGPSAIV